MKKTEEKTLNAVELGKLFKMGPTRLNKILYVIGLLEPDKPRTWKPTHLAKGLYDVRTRQGSSYGLVWKEEVVNILRDSQLV